MAKDKELPSQEIQDALKSIVEHFDKEDRDVRERQIREYRRNKFYWDGFTNIFWSQTNHDWRIIDTQVDIDFNEITYYDKRINIYQAYLESIIAVLSAQIPGIKAYPDDAENPLDITTAKACDNIYELLKRHNNYPILWLKALFILATEGLIAGKICKEANKKYGTYKEPEYEDYQESKYICPSCGVELPEEMFLQNSMIQDPMMMNQMEPELICPECGYEIDPAQEKVTLTLQRIKQYNEQPKSRILIDCFGGLFVKVPIYARNQDECLYLMYSYETHYANIQSEYPHLKDAFTDGYNSVGFNEPYEKWGRLSTQYLGAFPTNTLTCKHTWLRPKAYHIYKDDIIVDRLLKDYPEGCCVTLVEDRFAEVTNAKLDDEWVLSKNPLADYITFQPIGTKMVDVQDITNELISITLQTIEHGIPQTFVDPNVLNFNEYSQTSVTPGMIYPATPKVGKTLGDAFYEVKTATLSQEVMPFGQNIQSLGQLSVGALPALFGGAATTGSETASEYAMSKNQATQRLQTSWKMLCNWWRSIHQLAVPAFMECVVEDEKFVKKDQFNNYINVFIRKSELEGTIGNIELEASDNLPQTYQQKKESLMQFLQAANPIVLEALVDPVNLPILAEMVGLSEVSLPGMDDRTKQYEEIAILVQTQPIEMPGMIQDPMTGMGMEDPTGGEANSPQMMPSIEVEPDVDNHQVHIQVCKSWLVSEPGRLAKVENPAGYQNVLLHLKQHLMFIQMSMMPAQNGTGAVEDSTPPNDKMAAPLKGGKVNES